MNERGEGNERVVSRGGKRGELDPGRMRSNGPPFVAFVASHLSSKDSFPILPDSYSILRVSIPPLLSALHHSYLRRRRSLRYEIEKRK